MLSYLGTNVNIVVFLDIRSVYGREKVIKDAFTIISTLC